MTTERDWELIQKLERERREGELVRARIVELHEKPIQGEFDAEHLKAVHAYIFQDLPEHQPGIVRADSDGWRKVRELEGQGPSHVVHYAHEDVAGRIENVLDQFGGPDALRGLAPHEAATRLAQLYGDLDHAHGFYEGNSRTLREFTRELADAAGFTLDWIKTGIDAEQRNALYVARDIAVLERAYPGLTEERAMTTEDRAEYEAWWHLEKLRDMRGDQSLEAIIGDRLEIVREHQAERDYIPDVVQERDVGSESRGTDGGEAIEDAGIMVLDGVVNVAVKLADFVADLFSAFLAPAEPKRTVLQQLGEDPAERVARIKAGYRAEAALESIRGDLQRGSTISAADVRSLSPGQLQQIAQQGDAGLLAMVKQLEEQRERERDQGQIL